MRNRDVRHLEWRDRTSGATLYVDDLPPTGVLVASVLRSPHRHARIVSIDTGRAAASPGVRAVVTGADFPDRRYSDYGTQDRPPLARDEVRFVGQDVAAVAAVSEGAARAALDLIRVTYAPLPLFPTFESQLASETARSQDSVAGSIDRFFGDRDALNVQTPVSVSGVYRFGSQAHACMEPQAVMADWDPATQVLSIWAPSQGPRNVQREIAKVLALDLDQVWVHQIAAGGDFGARVRPGDIEALTAALAIKAEQKVRMVLSRNDEYAHTKRRHDFVVRLTTGADADGRIVRREGDILVESGGYAQAGVSEMGYCSQLLASQYRADGAHFTGTAFYTHRRPGGAFRGAGSPQAAFAIESQMDELADLVGADPIDLRVLNAHTAGETTIAGWEIESSRLVDCLQTVRDQVGWDAKRPLSGSGYGIGIAGGMHVSGAMTTAHATTSSATVEVDRQGSIVVRTGAGDPGTGQSMVAGILVADELGVTPEQLQVVYADTTETPYDPGAGASRGTFMTGSAALGAGRETAARLRALASKKLSVSEDQIRLKDGFALAGDESLSFGDLVALSPDAVDGVLRVEYTHVVNMPLVEGPTGHGNLSPTYGFAAHAVELDVDRMTGRVNVTRVVAVHDSGTIVNPIGARGQVVGGIVMALGAALGEELVYVEDRLANGSYTEYALPRAADAPDVSVTFLESDGAGPGPHGAKGLAEVALAPVAAAVANAVAHAIGVRITELPITPDKILNALEADGRAGAPMPSWRNTSGKFDRHRWWVLAMRWAYPHGLHAVLHRFGTRFARRRAPSVPIQIVVPSTPVEAADELKRDRDTRPLGGGSDLLVARNQGLLGGHVLVDLTRVADLTTLQVTAAGDLRIGGAATLDQLAAFASEHGDDALAATIDTIATPQVRSAATVGGNLCQEKRCGYFRNGFSCYKRGGVTCPCYAVLGDHRFYHAAVGGHRCQATTPSDLATTFAALDAVVEVQGPDGVRRLAIDRLFKGPGETTLRDGEFIAHVVIPAAARRWSTAFKKLRLYDGGFALVAASVSLEVDHWGRITDCRAVLGGIAPKPLRAAATEKALIGCTAADGRLEQACTAWTATANPLPGNVWKLRAGSGLLTQATQSALESRALAGAGDIAH